MYPPLQSRSLAQILSERSENVNGYLTRLGSHGVVQGQEKIAVSLSTETLNDRLKAYFGDEVSEQFVFGSYSRGTNLPRSMDAGTDVDHMVVFSRDNLKPQTYLGWLKDFAENSYSTSVQKQDYPTVRLELNHVVFELVPALKDEFGLMYTGYGYRIPAPTNMLAEWTNSDPNGFNGLLTDANTNHGSFIKPTVRLLKYWNALMGKPFTSFELEKTIIGTQYQCWHSCKQLKQHFYDAAMGLNDWPRMFLGKPSSTDNLKKVIREIQEFERNGKGTDAVAQIKKLLPWP